jgi:hypothetical protein
LDKKKKESSFFADWLMWSIIMFVAFGFVACRIVDIIKGEVDFFGFLWGCVLFALPTTIITRMSKSSTYDSGRPSDGNF